MRTAEVQSKGRTVGAVATLAGLTVRTLHHYDAIGLLRPSERSEAGYRLYTADDLDRLQEILLFRELGLSLDTIGEIVGDDGYDRASALRRHRRMLQDKATRLAAMIESVDAALGAHEEGRTMPDTEKFEVFGDFDPDAYRQEAEDRWGGTPQFAESQRKTAGYSKDDWEEITAEAEGIALAFAEAMGNGVDPEDAAAMDIAERHRRHISARFYDCSHEAHDGLGQMYVADARFTAYWDAFAVGLAGYVSTAITANALRS